MKLNADQCRLIYLIARLKLEYVIAEASKEHHGLSCVDEAAALLHDLETAGLIDASVMNGRYWEPNHERKVTPEETK